MLVEDLWDENVNRIINKIKDDAIAKLRSNEFNPGAIWQVISDLNLRHVHGYEIRDFLEPYKDEILNFLANRWTNGDPHREEYDLYTLISTMRSLDENAGLKWPELTTILNNLKPKIVKMLLILFKDEEYPKIRTLLGILKDFVPTWPELTTIQDSMQSDLRQRGLIPEAQSNYYPPSSIHRLINDLSDMLYNYDTYDDERPEGVTTDEIEADMPWCLAMIGLSDSDVPNRILMIQPHKDSILKIMLMAVRDPFDFDNTSMGTKAGLTAMVKGIRRLGAKWPELDVIEKSLAHDASEKYQLGEDLVSDPIKPFEIRNLKDLLISAIIESAYRRNHYNREPNKANISKKINALDYASSDFNMLMNKYKADILGICEIRRVNLLVYISISLMKMALLTKFGYNWPEFKLMINQNKEYIVKIILKNIIESAESMSEKERKFTDAINIVTDLEDLGIHWSELDVIKKSLLHDTTKNDISEARDPYMTYYRRYEREDALRRILSSLHKEIQAEDYEGINADFLELWKYPKSAFKGLYELLAPLKAGMIKEILTYISSGDIQEAAHAVPLWVKACRKCGFDWPELDVIEKSAAAGLVPKPKKLRESLNPEQKKNIYKEIQKELGEGNLMRALYSLTTRKVDFNELPELKQLFDYDKKGCMYRLDSSYGLDMYMKVVNAIKMLMEIGVDWPELPNFMEERKGNTIRNLFHYMKKGQPDTVITLIHELRDAGIEWPELDVILKSIEHELFNRKKA